MDAGAAADPSGSGCAVYTLRGKWSAATSQVTLTQMSEDLTVDTEAPLTYTAALKTVAGSYVLEGTWSTEGGGGPDGAFRCELQSNESSSRCVSR